MEKLLDILEEFVMYDHDSDPYFSELQNTALKLLHEYNRLPYLLADDQTGWV
jgi:hypothetical protein